MSKGHDTDGSLIETLRKVRESEARVLVKFNKTDFVFSRIGGNEPSYDYVYLEQLSYFGLVKKTPLRKAITFLPFLLPFLGAIFASVLLLTMFYSEYLPLIIAGDQTKIGSSIVLMLIVLFFYRFISLALKRLWMLTEKGRALLQYVPKE